MSNDTSRQFPEAFKGAACGRTGVLGGSRLFHQLTDDPDRPRPAPSLARLAWLAWLERPDPDSERQGRLTTLPLPRPPSLRSEEECRYISAHGRARGELCQFRSWCLGL
jgi:hypothetical protein